MNKTLYDILDNLSEGITIINDNLKVIYWNSCMEQITKISQMDIIGNDIISYFPNFNKKCFTDAFQDVKNNGVIRFFSAAMHKELISASELFNLKLSRLEYEGKYSILLEFINVTSQINQISLLKTYVGELWEVNKELKEKEKTIRKLAYYDRLTQVANRTLFYELSNKLLSNAKRNDSLLGLMFIDINKFKKINDKFGHEIGDRVLVWVADMLVKSTREDDVVARYGGDEFLILLPNMHSISDYNIVASRIIKIKNKMLIIEEQKIPLSLSMGISIYPNDGDTIDKLIVKADAAMYIAKRREGEDNCYCSSYIM